MHGVGTQTASPHHVICAGVLTDSAQRDMHFDLYYNCSLFPNCDGVVILRCVCACAMVCVVFAGFRLVQALSSYHLYL